MWRRCVCLHRVIDVALLVAHVHASHGDHVSIVPKFDFGFLEPNGIQYPDPGYAAIDVPQCLLPINSIYTAYRATYGILNHLALGNEVQTREPIRIATIQGGR